MSKDFVFDDSPEDSQSKKLEALDFIRFLGSKRDLKTGRFKKGHSGNSKGRPRARTTWTACLNKTLAEKTTVNIGGKRQSMSNMQLACDMIFKDALTRKDSKLLMQFFKFWGSYIDLSGELPSPKSRPKQKDPYYDENVEKIKRAILGKLDSKRDAENAKYPCAKDRFITNDDEDTPDDYIVQD